MANVKQKFEDLLSLVIKEAASDLHIAVGRHPTLRIDGVLTPIISEDVMTPESVQDFAFSLLNEDQRKHFLEEKESDFSYNFRDRARFRVNVFLQRGYTGVVMRLIPAKIQTLEELNMPSIIEQLIRQQGFLLIVGPTGHGKSTTLAAMVDYINHNRADHIITVEDPVEYLFTSDRAIIDQREVGGDTFDFPHALKSVFRQDVDVVMVGEMRDAETIATAVTAAETGHLVISSLHTNDAAQTIDRIIDSFPAAQQQQIRTQLSSTLIGIVSQRLIPRISGGLIPAVEVLIANSAVRNLIRENRVHEVDLVVETSFDIGMISLNRSLIDLVRKGEISMENAISYSLNPEELQTTLKAY